MRVFIVSVIIVFQLIGFILGYEAEKDSGKWVASDGATCVGHAQSELWCSWTSECKEFPKNYGQVLIGPGFIFGCKVDAFLQTPIKKR